MSMRSSSGPPTLVADNGRKSFEIMVKDAKQFYKLISATKGELSLLQKAGYEIDLTAEFEAREG